MGKKRTLENYTTIHVKSNGQDCEQVWITDDRKPYIQCHISFLKNNPCCQLISDYTYQVGEYRLAIVDVVGKIIVFKWERKEEAKV